MTASHGSTRTSKKVMVMNNEAMDYVREDCRQDAVIDRVSEVRRRWPWNEYPDDEDRIEPYDETDEVRRKDDDFNDW